MIASIRKLISNTKRKRKLTIVSYADLSMFNMKKECKIWLYICMDNKKTQRMPKSHANSWQNSKIRQVLHYLNYFLQTIYSWDISMKLADDVKNRLVYKLLLHSCLNLLDKCISKIWFRKSYLKFWISGSVCDMK